MTAQAALDADTTEVDAAAEALKGVREESKVGTRTTLDVLNAEQELPDAQIDQVKSQRDRDFAVLQIKAAVGILRADNLKLPVEIYDPKRHYEDARGQWVGFSKDDTRYKSHPSIHQHCSSRGLCRPRPNPPSRPKLREFPFLYSCFASTASPPTRSSSFTSTARPSARS